MCAHHSDLYLDFDLFIDCVTNGISEFRDQVPSIGGPSRGFGVERRVPKWDQDGLEEAEGLCQRQCFSMAGWHGNSCNCDF